ncbi:MAG: MFS transporter [Acetobacteraceae bacterium]|nr:MFS transporter [Acetobacteraceae bacterium]
MSQEPRMSLPTGRKRPRPRYVLLDNPVLRALCLSMAIMNIGYAIIIPVLPVYSDRYHTPAAVLGLMFTGFALGRALVQVAGGALVGRWGDRLVGTLAVGLIALPTLCLAFAVHPAALLASRVVWGTLEGLAIPAIYSLVARCEKVERQGEAMGAFGASAVAGMALGPVVGAYALMAGGIALTFSIGAAVHLAAAAMLFHAARPQALRPAPQAPGEAATVGRGWGDETPGAIQSSPPRAWWRPAAWAAAAEGLGAAVALGCVDLANNLAYGMVEPVLPLQLSRLGYSPRDVSLVFTLGLAVFAVGSLGLGRLCDRAHPVRLLGGTLAAAACAVATLSLAQALWTVFLVFGGFMVTQCLIYILARKLVREMYSEERARARAFGLFGTLSDLGFIVGPAVGSLTFSAAREGVFWAFGAAMLPFLAAVWAAGRLYRERRGLRR